MPRSINHTGTPYKYQLDILLQKAELSLSNPLGKLSFVFRINNQRVESTSRIKALKEVVLNELVSTPVSFYETSENNYEETILHLDMFLNQTKSSKIIGVADINITDLANVSNRLEGEEEFYITLEKSPEYKAKLLLKVGIKCLGMEIIEKPNFNTKKRGHSNIPQKTYEFEEEKSEIMNTSEIEIKQKSHQVGKTRSVTPTPASNSLAKQTITKNELLEKKKPLVNSKIIEDVENERKVNQQRETKIETVEKVERNEKVKKSGQKIDQNFLMNTPIKKEKLENIPISTIPALSDTLNTTLEESTLKKEDQDVPPRRRDTFGFKSQDPPENNDDLIIFEGSSNNTENSKQLESLKEENKNLLKEKVRLENLLSEIKDVKKGIEKEQNEKLIIVSRENSVLKDDLQKKNMEISNIFKKNEEMKSLLEEKETEVKRLEELASGLQKEILLLRKELREGFEAHGSENVHQLKGFIQKLEGDLLEKNLEKNEVLKKKDEELKELKKSNALLMENNTKLQQNLLAYSKEFGNEKIGLKEELKKVEDHKENLKKELGRKETKIIELESNLKALQQKYIKTKEEVADIINLIFEKGGIELMEEIEGFMSNLSEISKEFETKLSEKRF